MAARLGMHGPPGGKVCRWGDRPRELVGLATCSLVPALLCVLHAARIEGFCGDDVAWLRHASRGLRVVWSTPSPFRHFRPVAGSWFAGVGWIAQDSATLHLLGGLALYVATLVPFAILARRFLSPRAALIACLLFGAHPARSEHLFWVSGQIDSLCLLLSLAAICCALNRSIVLRGASWLLCAAAFLTKESAAVVPLLIVVVEEGRLVARLKRLLVLITAPLAGLLLQHWVLNEGGRAWSILSAARIQFATLMYPARLLIPIDLSPHWSGWHIHRDPISVLFLVVYAAVGCALLFVVLHHDRASLSVVPVALLLAGALIWVMRPDDRGIGLGVAGVCLLLPGALAGIRHSRWLVPAVSVALVLWAGWWFSSDRLWIEASRISEAIRASHREWPIDHANTLRIGVGHPARVGGTAEVTALSELGNDLCDALQIEATAVRAGLTATRAGEDVCLDAGPGAIFRDPPPTAFPLDRATPDRICARACDLPLLCSAAALGKAGRIELRYWSGNAFVPLAECGASDLRVRSNP